MKLLFDQNLPRRLAAALGDLYPGSTHVQMEGLTRGSDAAIWAYAKERGFAIVSKDTDFYQRSILYGHPPKVVWVNVGNCTTEFIEILLRRRGDAVAAFAEDADASFLVLS